MNYWLPWKKKSYPSFVKVFTGEAVLHVIFPHGIAVGYLLTLDCNCNR